jgi:hypothetical protein
MRSPLLPLLFTTVLGCASDYGVKGFATPRGADEPVELVEEDEETDIPVVEGVLDPNPIEAPRGNAYTAINHCFNLDEDGLPVAWETGDIHDLPLEAMLRHESINAAALIAGAEARSGLTGLTFEDILSGVVPVHVAYRMDTRTESFSEYYGIGNLRGSIFITAGGETSPFTGLDSDQLEDIDNPFIIQCTNRAYIPETNGAEPDWANLLAFTAFTEVTDGETYLEAGETQYWLQRWFMATDSTGSIDLRDPSTYDTNLASTAMYYDYLDERLTPSYDHEFSAEDWDLSPIGDALDSKVPDFINDVFYITSAVEPGRYYIYDTSYYLD